MAAHIVIPIIIIIVVLIALIVTGYISDPLVDIPSFIIIGFISYRIFYIIIKTRKRNLFTYVGKIGKAVDNISPNQGGYIMVNGEYWEAVSNENIEAGDTVVVIGMQGLKLVVKKSNSNEVVV
ncbi:NfeD family protein [Acidianus brierleyi]|uniref:Serine protease n=1 Tax=Acidianus brierleyi TaxID=41673 RepID=A0A2U9IBV8_9CREN|nr:NfeD family protein [Acidianus brierleyi]AWR93502.1 NfeD family protein [Acidianus brierleyi]